MSENVINGQIIEAEVQENPKRSWRRTFKLIAIFTLVIASLAFAFWIFRVLSIYQEAKEYKKSHEIVQEQFQFCKRIQNEKQEKKIFDYCDEFSSRFKEIEVESK